MSHVPVNNIAPEPAAVGKEKRRFRLRSLVLSGVAGFVLGVASIIAVSYAVVPANSESDRGGAATNETKVENYSEAAYLKDTDVSVWSFDKTGEARLETGQSICRSLAKNEWDSSDPKSVTLAFANMQLRHTAATILTDEPDIPEVEGLEKSRYLVKYATRAFCPELHRDEVPSLEDVLAHKQESDERASDLSKKMKAFDQTLTPTAYNLRSACIYAIGDELPDARGYLNFDPPLDFEGFDEDQVEHVRSGRVQFHDDTGAWRDRSYTCSVHLQNGHIDDTLTRASVI